ncbi:MAG: hypothetical protein AABY83_12455 [Pseudomonadota bacterium]
MNKLYVLCVLILFCSTSISRNVFSGELEKYVLSTYVRSLGDQRTAINRYKNVGKPRITEYCGQVESDDDGSRSHYVFSMDGWYKIDIYNETQGVKVQNAFHCREISKLAGDDVGKVLKNRFGDQHTIQYYLKFGKTEIYSVVQRTTNVGMDAISHENVFDFPISFFQNLVVKEGGLFRYTAFPKIDTDIEKAYHLSVWDIFTFKGVRYLLIKRDEYASKEFIWFRFSAEELIEEGWVGYYGL